MLPILELPWGLPQHGVALDPPIIIPGHACSIELLKTFPTPFLNHGKITYEP